MGDEDNLWTLGSPMTTLKIGSPNASTATNMSIWQKNANQRRKNIKLGNVSNMKRKNIYKGLQGNTVDEEIISPGRIR